MQRKAFLHYEEVSYVLTFSNDICLQVEERGRERDTEHIRMYQIERNLDTASEYNPNQPAIFPPQSTCLLGIAEQLGLR